MPWLPDPTGRHELRWHEDTGWSDQVQDRGVPGTDAWSQPFVLAPGETVVKPRRWLPIVIGGALAVVVGLAVAFTIDQVRDRTEKHTIKGVFTLFDKGEDFGKSCSGSGGYDDISLGLDVVVKDGADKVIATSELESGKGSGPVCTFGFTVDGVPRVDFYAIEVGRRGRLTYKYDDLAELKWIVLLSIGL